MKKLLIIPAFVLSAMLSNSNTAQAQVSISFNIGTQPVWGPTGYDQANYYYLPDADAYYDVNARVFYFLSGGRWISGPSLPGQYANFDLYHAHKVVINSPRPWMHAARYRSQYGHFRGMHDQMAIRDSRDERYFQNPGHPQHSSWVGQHPNGGGNFGSHGNRGGGNYGGRNHGGQPGGNRGGQPGGNQPQGNAAAQQHNTQPGGQRGGQTSGTPQGGQHTGGAQGGQHTGGTQGGQHTGGTQGGQEHGGH